MNKIGFFVSQVDYNRQVDRDMLHTVDDLARHGHSIEAVIFCGELVNICGGLLVPILPMESIWSYDGWVISHDVSLFDLMGNLKNPVKKSAFLWDLVWIYTHNDYNYYRGLLQRDDIEYYTRSPEMATAYKNTWNMDAKVLESYTANRIMEMM